MNLAVAKEEIALFSPISTESIQSAYGRDGLSTLPNFYGKYINFGYWKDIDFEQLKIISLDERLQSSSALYNLVFDHCKIKQDEAILEIGCGLGVGCKQLVSQYNPRLLIGIDLSQYHIKSCIDNHSFPNLYFKCINGEKTSFPNNSFDKIYSVEMIQHVLDFEKFSKELYRILNVGGQVTLAAHLALSSDSLISMRKRNLFVKENIDVLTPITTVKDSLEASGFKNIKVCKIGNNVFAGYDKWLSQSNCSTPWSRNLYKSYSQNYIDYFLIEASK